jgi:hypothetical protein
METTYIRSHERDAAFRSSTGVTVVRDGVRHVRWLYRAFRADGMGRGDARMNLCHAIAAGQRDMRTRVEDSMRGVR